MTLADKDQFGLIFDALMAPYTLTNRTLAKSTFFEALFDLPIEALEKAARQLTASWTRRNGTPTPGDWRIEAESLIQRDSATDRRPLWAQPKEPALRDWLSAHNTAPAAERPLSHDESAALLAPLQAGLKDWHLRWHPTTRDDFHALAALDDLIEAHKHPLRPTPRLTERALEALRLFGGLEAIAVVATDELDTYRIARKAFARFYAEAA